MRGPLLFLVLSVLSLLYGIARGVEVPVDEVIEAPGNFTPTLAEGDEAVYERWMDLCMADSKCSELYGLSETTNLMQFIHLITLTSPFPGDPLYSENALVYNIYGKTPEELEEQILVDQMKLGILCSNFVCGVNEKPTVTNGTVTCNPLPGRSPSDRNIGDVVLKILIAAGSLMLLVYIIKSGYLFSNESWKTSIQAFIQTHPQPPSLKPRVSTTVPGTTPTNPKVIPAANVMGKDAVHFPTSPGAHYTSGGQRVSHRTSRYDGKPAARNQPRGQDWS
jgi:hypothetical protein